MSANYSFKNMSEVEELAAPTENTKVFGFENGEPVRIPAGALYNPLYFDINFNTEIADSVCTLNYDPIYEAVIIGRPVILRETYLDGEVTKVMHEIVAGWKITNGENFAVFTGAWWYEGLGFTNGSYHGAATTE